MEILSDSHIKDGDFVKFIANDLNFLEALREPTDNNLAEMINSKIRKLQTGKLGKY